MVDMNQYYSGVGRPSNLTAAVSYIYDPALPALRPVQPSDFASINLSGITVSVDEVGISGLSPRDVTLVNNSSATGSSAASYVGTYTQHTVQVITTGIISLDIRTSLNATNWFVEYTATGNDMQYFQGPMNYFSTNYTSGNSAITVLLKSAP